MEKKEKEALHQSSLSLLFKCGIAYEFRYVKGLKIPPNASMISGSGTHKSIEFNLNNKIKTKKFLPIDEAQDIARDEVKNLWNQGVRLSEDEAVSGVKEAKGNAVDKAIALSALHHKEVAPVLNPTEVESEFVLELENYPYDVAGKIDIIEDVKSVRDTKTSGKSPNKNSADISDQLTMYYLAQKIKNKTAPEHLYLDYLYQTPKNKTCKNVTIPTERDDSDVKVLLALIEQSMKILKSGIFTPAPSDFWMCSKKWCGYFEICPYSRKRVSVPNLKLP